jgi:hypothetical protein
LWLADHRVYHVEADQLYRLVLVVGSVATVDSDIGSRFGCSLHRVGAVMTPDQDRARVAIGHAMLALDNLQLVRPDLATPQLLALAAQLYAACVVRMAELKLA